METIWDSVWRVEGGKLVWTDDCENGDELTFTVEITDERFTLDDIAAGLDFCVDGIADTDGTAVYFWRVCGRKVYRIIYHPKHLRGVQLIATLGPGKATHSTRADGLPASDETHRLVVKGCDHAPESCVDKLNLDDLP